MPDLPDCRLWTTPEEVGEVCEGTDATKLPALIQVASFVLFRLSGRRYRGACVRTVRPCRTDWCGWGGGVLSRGHIIDEPGFGQLGRTCSCGWEPTIDLAAYPVQSVDQVAIDGVILDEAAYRLDRKQLLVRIDGGAWPICQNQAAPDDGEGAFAVSYTWGAPVPEAGRLAASQLVCELYAALYNHDACAMPRTVTRVVRAGVSVETQVLAYLGDRKRPSGLALVDAFLAVSPSKRAGGLMIPGLPSSPRPTT